MKKLLAILLVAVCMFSVFSLFSTEEKPAKDDKFINNLTLVYAATY